MFQEYHCKSGIDIFHEWSLEITLVSRPYYYFIFGIAWEPSFAWNLTFGYNLILDSFKEILFWSTNTACAL